MSRKLTKNQIISNLEKELNAAKADCAIAYDLVRKYKKENKKLISIKILPYNTILEKISLAISCSKKHQSNKKITNHLNNAIQYINDCLQK